MGLEPKKSQTRSGDVSDRHSAHVARQNRFSVKKVLLAADGMMSWGYAHSDESLMVNDNCFHKRDALWFKFSL